MPRSAYDLETPRVDDWRDDAACRSHDPELWALKTGRSGWAYSEAHRICDTCPVRAECEGLAVRLGAVGMIFGGRDFWGGRQR